MVYFNFNNQKHLNYWIETNLTIYFNFYNNRAKWNVYFFPTNSVLSVLICLDLLVNNTIYLVKNGRNQM